MGVTIAVCETLTGAKDDFLKNPSTETTKSSAKNTKWKNIIGIETFLMLLTETRIELTSIQSITFPFSRAGCNSIVQGNC